MPDPIDIHVGNRLKLRRAAVGLSQEQLSQTIGVTFQQLQKYEKGQNRLSASRLWMVAGALGKPVDYFFMGLDGGPRAPALDDVIDEVSATDMRAIRDYLALPAAMRPPLARLVKELRHAEKS